MTTARDGAHKLIVTIGEWHEDAPRVIDTIECAGQLMEVVDARFAELREKGNQCSTPSGPSPCPPCSSESPSRSTGEPPSLDARAEALFAANPEWRPRVGECTLQRKESFWYWSGSLGFAKVEPTVGFVLLAALLPRAIEKWINKNECDSGVFFSDEWPPRTLSEALDILEGE